MHLWILLAVLAATAIVLSIAFPHKPRPKRHNIENGKCTAACSADALDPINDPDYNVKEVIKNTLLIEQHLSEKKKYCKPCLLKHYLLSQALLDEAVWMAGCSCKEYPNLEESLEFYENNFQKWHKNMDDDENRLQVLEELRAWRQKMIELYYFKS